MRPVIEGGFRWKRAAWLSREPSKERKGCSTCTRCGTPGLSSFISLVDIHFDQFRMNTASRGT